MTRPAFDLSLYLVTDTDQCGERGLVNTVRDAVAGGVSIVQVRDPDASDEELAALAQLVKSVLNGTGVPLIINDRVHLVDRVGADGAHIGQTDMPVAEARAMLGPDALLGLSVHSEADLAAALEHGDALDYIGVGPVWATTSKPDAEAPIGVNGLRTIVSASPWPTVAIGGVSALRVPRLPRTGVDGIAVISAICRQPDAQAAAMELSLAWQGAPA